ncbi:unnamed protein product [Ophioblennius macclurei]
MSTSVLMTAMMVMMLMKSEAEVVRVWTTDGASVLLDSGLRTRKYHEVRWTHEDLLVSTNRTENRSGCELLSNGSLRLFHITQRVAGNYKLEVFGDDGKLMHKREFDLYVNESHRNIAEHSAAISCSVLLLLLLLFITLFNLWRVMRRRTKKKCAIQAQVDNTYVAMHRGKEERGKIIQEENDHYVSCQPAVSTDTDIYI